MRDKHSQLVTSGAAWAVTARAPETWPDRVKAAYERLRAGRLRDKGYTAEDLAGVALLVTQDWDFVHELEVRAAIDALKFGVVRLPIAKRRLILDGISKAARNAIRRCSEGHGGYLPPGDVLGDSLKGWERFLNCPELLGALKDENLLRERLQQRYAALCGDGQEPAPRLSDKAADDLVLRARFTEKGRRVRTAKAWAYNVLSLSFADEKGEIPSWARRDKIQQRIKDAAVAPEPAEATPMTEEQAKALREFQAEADHPRILAADPAAEVEWSD